MTAGRPTIYNEDMQTKADEYVAGFQDHGHEIPSAAGMAIVLGVNKSTLYEWAKREDCQFSDTLAYCNDFQEHILLNKGLKGEFNATITKLALANHGYHDKQEVSSKVSQTYVISDSPELTPEEWQAQQK